MRQLRTTARRVITTITLTLTLMPPAVSFASTTPTPMPRTNTTASGSALVSNEDIRDWDIGFVKSRW